MTTPDTPGAAPPLCEIDGLRIAFRGDDGRDTHAVRGLSLTLRHGERLGIVGESGSGKSLTGRALLGLLPPSARMSADGLRFEGRDLLTMSARERRGLCGRQMGMILQDPKYSLNPVMTVGRQMREAFRLQDPKAGRRELRERIVDALAAVQIRDPLRVTGLYPHELSGGMGQRVMIAMMVSNGPRVLVADEPTSALDVLVSMQVLGVLDRMIAQHDTGLVFISHDLPLVMSFCDRVVVMYAGRAVETCAARDLAHATHPYTRALLAANPPLANPPEWLPVMTRDPSWLDGPVEAAR
ncbi:ABC transporter ATP-binding protein [Paraburkholderia caballeronis]|uniref:Peptide/nickel transport system ATP-binding protein n=1 Tax=Paraburkholderia caballeronis TaxID=416943 RepID=A0A1H7NTF1_9BURK|nr:ABC transporter ATP-binding protein [Paraburkholderia caballeronis]PXW25558.1 peptide/nickel transport system ATP-binding protein [Paraburkholderia caballeronis]PXX01165.1 peptide/nickel transport system ATP-binding protein [Paraburkholderia caballeronis]RAJ99482.1 peptide/nickel transport system ATP-binding protein [Paraburkholderia caballeronis]TDV07194.1 peptide/nickel transport system ATP-binding protein [Paraburkholderia caballeronis]TDV11338.1 peptide/nickel transport system ATP-bindi